MLSLRKSIIAIVVLLLCTHSAWSQLQVINSSNANALAQKLVGAGVTISNATLTAAPGSTAFFKHLGNTQLNLDSGIALSTGFAQTLVNPGLNGPASNFADHAFNSPGDADLDNMITSVTNDAAVLEFDFIPLGDSIKFQYVFSSEEYPEWGCSSFNDVFAFLISGPGIVGQQNMALIPGTTIPVAINSVNDGLNGSLAVCQAMGAGSPFTQYYINNMSNGFFAHDGHTIVFTAAAQVVPCQTYHLKLAIADVTDWAYDSGVFIKAQSLTSDPVQIVTDLPGLNGIPYVVEGCTPGNIQILRSRKRPAPLDVNLTFGGNAINGTDVQLIPAIVTIPANDSVTTVPIIPIVDNLPEGTDSLKIYISSGCQLPGMAYLDSLTIYIRDYEILNVTPDSSVVCNNLPVQLNAAGNFNSIEWQPAAGLNDPTIANPIATVQGTVVFTATATTGTCIARDSVILKVKSLRLISKTDVLCKDGTTGQIRVSGGNAWQAPVQYNINNQAFGQDSTFNNLPVGNYIVRVKDGTGCIDSMSISIAQSYPDLLISDSLVTASCVGTNGEAFITATGGLAPYSYTVDANAFVATSNFNVTGGNHTLYVKDANGCITSKPVVINNDPPITFTSTPSQLLCNGLPSGYVYLSANGGTGNYEYSMDGTNYQVADSFLVSSNTVTFTVKDEKGCSASNTVNVPINDPVYVKLGNDTTICEGQTVQFNADYNGSIAWTANPSLSATNIPNPIASPVSTATYYVTVTKNICVARDTVTVNVLTAPLANAGPDSVICFGKSIFLNGSGGTGYEWLPANAVSDPSLQNPSITPDKTTRYYLSVTDANGCKSLKQDTVTVTVTPPLQVFAGADTSVAIGQSLQLNGMDLSGSGTIFTWSPATGLSDPTLPNPVAILNNNITYALTIETAEGCKGTDQILVRVFTHPEIYVPNGFTPNGDGKNDMLRAIPVGLKKFSYFRVFNRWGQMIFSTSNPGLGWDGKINGVKQNTGTFVWIAEGVDFAGNTIQRKGSTTLIR